MVSLFQIGRQRAIATPGRKRAREGEREGEFEARPFSPFGGEYGSGGENCDLIVGLQRNGVQSRAESEDLGEAGEGVTGLVFVFLGFANPCPKWVSRAPGWER